MRKIASCYAAEILGRAKRYHYPSKVVSALPDSRMRILARSRKFWTSKVNDLVRSPNLVTPAKAGV